MTDTTMTPDEEHDFYAQPENQEPQGPPRRRSARLTAPIPVRFPLRSSRRSGDEPARTTAQSRHGSAARSSTNCSAPHNFPGMSGAV